MNYPRYKHATKSNTFQEGLEFQDYCMETLARRFGWVIQITSSRAYQFNKGESIQGFEFKLDKRCTETGRLSIEIAEKSNRDVSIWTNSGILRNDNTIFYVQGNTETFWVFFKHHLLNWMNEYSPEIHEFNGTIRKFYISNILANDLGFRIDNANTTQQETFAEEDW